MSTPQNQFVAVSTMDANPLAGLQGGPVAIVFVHSPLLVTETFGALGAAGFPNIIAIGPSAHITGQAGCTIHISTDGASQPDTWYLNHLMSALDGRWVYYGQNADFLFFPFSEGRSVHDLTVFADEERRNSIFATTVDLYCRGDISQTGALLDTGGYFSLPHHENGHAADRQIDLFGGLRWRYAECFENHERNINRNVMFKAHSDLTLTWDNRFNDPEYNTISCPWHNNVTICVASFWAYKKMRDNGHSFDCTWFKSQPFDWSSTQLMKLGLMEPGQWF